MMMIMMMVMLSMPALFLRMWRFESVEILKGLCGPSLTRLDISDTRLALSSELVSALAGSKVGSRSLRDIRLDGCHCAKIMQVRCV